MAFVRESSKNKWLFFRLCLTVIPLIALYSLVERKNREKTVEKRELSTEIPIEYIDPAAIDLTPLVNKLLNTTQIGTLQDGSQHLFSLLSVTSHSSLALHRLTILVYNISNFRNIEPNLFPVKYCYCLSNKSSDLTDFTAILLDVMGNSTSYLHELFKSSSILSVAQSNDSECIYICVMAGKTDRDLSQLWETGSSKPLFNHTITANVHRGNSTVPQLAMEWYRLPTSSSNTSPPEPSEVETTRALSSPEASQAKTTPVTSIPKRSPVETTIIPLSPKPSVADSTTSHSSITAVLFSAPEHSTLGSSSTASRTLSHTPAVERLHKDAGCPWKRLVFGAAGGAEIARPTIISYISEPKLQPCVLELCRFFSQCLCRRDTKAGVVRYCIDNHPWYDRYTLEICGRVKRVSFSKSLKQKCLAKMCTKL